jgi:hypothetical protein
MGTRHLSAEDPSLLKLWEAEANNIRMLEDDSWDKAVIRILETYGYQVMSSETKSSG